MNKKLITPIWVFFISSTIFIIIPIFLEKSITVENNLTVRTHLYKSYKYANDLRNAEHWLIPDYIDSELILSKQTSGQGATIHWMEYHDASESVITQEYYDGEETLENSDGVLMIESSATNQHIRYVVDVFSFGEIFLNIDLYFLQGTNSQETLLKLIMIYDFDNYFMRYLGPLVRSRFENIAQMILNRLKQNLEKT